MAQPARYPLPRPVGLMRFPVPRIAPTPFLIRPPLGLVPPGYSANITQINGCSFTFFSTGCSIECTHL